MDLMEAIYNELQYGLSMAETFDLAGYSDLEGRLGRPIPTGHVLVPGKIWLDEHEFLNWHLCPDDEKRPRTYTPSPKLLNDFVKLWQAPGRILPFAKKYGVLWENAGHAEGREHLSAWRILSRKVSALLKIGAQLQLGDSRIDRHEWMCVQSFETRRLDRLTIPAEARAQLGLEISRAWLPNCGFSMQWNRHRKRFELEIDYRGAMMSAVGLQLALTISNSDSLYICSGCSEPYARSRDKRSPKTGEANFCDNCGTGAALRQADKRRKAKVAKARQLHDEGLAVTEIAKQLDAKVTSVRRWVKGGE
jgi:hypothetical protein